MRIQQYIQWDVIDSNWENWTISDKDDFRFKLWKEVKNHQDWMIKRHLDQTISYRDKKLINDDKPINVDAFWVKVTIDGKWDLNRRSGPSTNFEKLGKLPEWSVVEVTQEMNNWYKIVDEAGYNLGRIDGQYVQKTLKSETMPIQKVISNDVEESIDVAIKKVEVSPNDIWFLSIRNGPGKEFKIVWSVSVGQQIDVYEEKNAYFRVIREWEEARLAVNYVHLAWTEAPTHHLTKLTQNITDAWTLKNKQNFLDTYRHLVDSKDKPLLDLCKKYYDKIDLVAKQYDFPVELIIATWFREHTCKFKNPGNGRWNFQIITEYYPPGDISRAQFEAQIIDFIKFSEGKWKYYDLTQKFGPDPIELSYNDFDLASIRKQAIYYNWIVWTMEKNVYANQNFNGISVGWADWIVAAFLKTLKYGLEK